MSRVRVGSWNCHNADRATLARYIADRIKAGDVAICLTEVWSRHRDLHDIAARHGWRMLAETPGDRRRSIIPEQGDTVLLLSPKITDLEWSVEVLTKRWTVFSQHRLHEPRRLIHATGTLQGRRSRQRLELVAAHGPTAGNRDAVHEFQAVVGDIITRTRPGTLTVVFGDFNIRLDDARAWAKSIGATLAGHGPDLALVRGGRVKGRRGSKRTSDHYDLAYRIRTDRRSTR